MSDDLCRPLGGPGKEQSLRPAAERRLDFELVSQPWSAAEAAAAAQRCLADHVCTYCEVCQLMCPDQCITRDPDSGEILIDLDHCKGCGLCAHFCPKGAIAMEIEQG